MVRKTLYAKLSFTEDEHLFKLFITEEIKKCIKLLFLACSFNDVLVDTFTCIRGAHRNSLWVAEEALNKLLDLWSDCRTKEESLTVFRSFLNDRSNVVDESHVEHAVSLVEHECADEVKLQYVTLHEVTKATWRTNNDVWTTTELLNLTVNVCTTHNKCREKLHTVREGTELLVNLLRKLASWSNNKH